MIMAFQVKPSEEICLISLIEIKYWSVQREYQETGENVGG